MLQRPQLHDEQEGIPQQRRMSHTTVIAETLSGRSFLSQITPNGEEPTHIRLHAYRALSGQEIISEVPANQDVIDVITYVKKGDKIFLATMSNVRPGPLVHDMQSTEAVMEYRDFIELPASIIRADLGETELTTTAERVVRYSLTEQRRDSVLVVEPSPTLSHMSRLMQKKNH